MVLVTVQECFSDDVYEAFELPNLGYLMIRIIFFSVLEESPYREQIWFHTDSAQTVGKVEVDVARLGVDFLTVVGHKVS